MSSPEPYILLFDGVCNLCNGAVQFVIKHDKKKRVKFASLQSEAGQAYLKKFGLPADEFHSFVLVQADKYWLRSTAALKLASVLGGGWKLLYGFMIVPKILRDVVYNMVARSRYKVFGKRESCMLPGPELKDRFL